MDDILNKPLAEITEDPFSARIILKTSLGTTISKCICTSAFASRSRNTRFRYRKR